MRIVDWQDIPIHWRLWDRPVTSYRWIDTGLVYHDVSKAVQKRWVKYEDGIFVADGTDPNVCG